MPRKEARLATTQWTSVEPPPEAVRFSDVFSFDAARRFSLAQIEGNARLLAQAGEAGADLAVAREDIAAIFTASLYLDDRSVFRTLAAETSRHSCEVLGEVARRHRMHIVASFFEPEGESISNSAVLSGRDGSVLGRYHKVQLPAHGMWQVTAGDSFTVCDADLAAVGMLICYDAIWPEAPIACALDGAQIICHPTIYNMEEYRVRARARDLQVFYITPGYVDSCIAAPNGEMLADAAEHADVAVTAQVDLSRATLAPMNYWEYLHSGIRDHRERHLKLRRARAYRVIVHPSPPALRSYPEGGLATTPEAIREAYQRLKQDRQRALRGERTYCAWEWSMADEPGRTSSWELRLVVRATCARASRRIGGEVVLDLPPPSSSQSRGENLAPPE